MRWRKFAIAPVRRVAHLLLQRLRDRGVRVEVTVAFATFVKRVVDVLHHSTLQR